MKHGHDLSTRREIYHTGRIAVNIEIHISRRKKNNLLKANKKS